MLLCPIGYGLSRFPCEISGCEPSFVQGTTAIVTDIPSTTGEQFTRLLLENRSRILGFVLSLMPGGADAEDVFQDVCVILWRKFDQYEPGTDFVAWALAIARFEIKNYFKEQAARPAQLSDVANEAVYQQYTTESFDEVRSARSEVLATCLQRLKPEQHALIRDYYHNNDSVEVLAGRMQLSVAAVYKRLNRSRKQLAECVRSIMASRGIR